MTVRNLIQQYRAYQPGGVFFNRDVLANYGERIGDMRVTGKGVISTHEGNRICWELVTTQRHPLLGTRQKRYYFDIDTFAEIIPDDGNTATPWENKMREEVSFA